MAAGAGAMDGGGRGEGNIRGGRSGGAGVGGILEGLSVWREDGLGVMNGENGGREIDEWREERVWSRF